MTWGVFAVAEGSDVAVARVAPAGELWGGGGRLEFRRDASLPWAGQRVALCPPGSAPTRCAQCVASGRSLVGFALLRFSGSSAAPRSGSRVFGQSGCPRRQWLLVSQPGPSLLHTEIGRKLEIRPPEGPAPLFPGCDGVVFAWSATCSGQFCARPCPSRHLSWLRSKCSGL